MILNLSGEQACALLHAIDDWNTCTNHRASAIHSKELLAIKTRIEKAQAK